MASESESESDPATTEDDFAGCSFAAGGAAGPTAAGGCDNVPSSRLEAALQENQSLKEANQSLNKQVAILQQLRNNQDQDNSNLRMYVSLLEEKLRKLQSAMAPTSVAGAEVHGDTGSSVGAPTDAQAPSQSTTPSLQAWVDERMGLKSREKASAKHPMQSLRNAGDVPRLHAQMEMEATDKRKRDDDRAFKIKHYEEARQANEARYSFRPREQQGAASSDRDNYDGTWASVNGPLTIRQVQDRDDYAELVVLETLGRQFKYDLAEGIDVKTKLRNTLDGLGCKVEDLIVHGKKSLCTVAFKSEADAERFDTHEKQTQLPRFMKEVRPYKCIIKPQVKEAAVRFKNVSPSQFISEEWMREMAGTYGTVRDVYFNWSSSPSPWKETGNIFRGFVEFEPDSGGAERLMQACFPYDVSGDKHDVLRGPEDFIAFWKWT